MPSFNTEFFNPDSEADIRELASVLNDHLQKLSIQTTESHPEISLEAINQARDYLRKTEEALKTGNFKLAALSVDMARSYVFAAKDDLRNLDDATKDLEDN